MKQLVAAALIAVVMLAAPLSVQAQDRSGIKPLEDLTKGALALFDWMQSKMDNYVAAEKERRLVNRLFGFGKKMYDVEKDKQYFLNVLRRPEPDEEQLRVAIYPLESSVQRMANDLKNLGFEIRMISPFGRDVEDKLSTAIQYRKGWVEEVARSFKQKKPIDRAKVLEEGDAAVKALQDANEKLTKLIDTLKAKSKS